MEYTTTVRVNSYLWKECWHISDDGASPHGPVVLTLMCYVLTICITMQLISDINVIWFFNLLGLRYVYLDCMSIGQLSLLGILQNPPWFGVLHRSRSFGFHCSSGLWLCELLAIPCDFCIFRREFVSSVCLVDGVMCSWLRSWSQSF